VRLLSSRFRKLTVKSKLAFTAAATLLVLASVPLWPWRPTCRCQEGVQGDLRDVYVDEFAGSMRRENVS
jgi:hypothetical protein